MIRRTEIVNPNHLYTKTVTGNYTVTDRDEVLLVDATAAAVTITLPDAVAQKNLALYIKKIDSSGNAVTVATSLSQTIDGGATVSLASQYATLAVVADGANWQIKTVSASGTFTGGTITGATTVSVASATAFVVGANGTTNPVLQVDSNAASVVTGLLIQGKASGSNLQLNVISSATNEGLYFTSKGTGTIRMQPGTDTTGAFALVSAGAGAGTTYVRADSTNKRLNVGSGAAPTGTLETLSTSANNFLAGASATNPQLQVDASTASAVTGIKIKGAAAGGGVAISAISSGADESITINAKGAGIVAIGTPTFTHTPTAINSTATATAAQVATGYITSTSAAATSITLPTGTALGTQIGAVQGTVMDLFIDNTAGANTVTIVVNTNAILSAAAAANAASQGLLTVPSGVTGQACFRLMFSSATAYTITRVA